MVVIAVSIAVLLVVVSAVAVVVARRRRRADPAETAAERALRASDEQVAAQDRATEMHPDAVRDWMRPH